jgi:hypothetical protein
MTYLVAQEPVEEFCLLRHRMLERNYHHLVDSVDASPVTIT